MTLHPKDHSSHWKFARLGRYSHLLGPKSPKKRDFVRRRRAVYEKCSCISVKCGSVKWVDEILWSMTGRGQLLKGALNTKSLAIFAYYPYQPTCFWNGGYCKFFAGQGWGGGQGRTSGRGMVPTWSDCEGAKRVFPPLLSVSKPTTNLFCLKIPQKCNSFHEYKHFLKAAPTAPFKMYLR